MADTQQQPEQHDASAGGGGDTPSSSSTNDPAGLLTPSPQVVKVVNTARADLNDRLGLTTGYSVERERYTVKFGTVEGDVVLSFRPNNLVRAGQVEKLRYRAQSLQRQATDLYNDPNVQRQLRQIYTAASNRLPPYLPPERAAIVGLVVLLFAVRQLGITRTFMLLSLLSIPVVVSLPDIQRGSGLNDLFQNFPRNLRDALVQSTGYAGITEGMATAGFVLVVALSVRVLLRTDSSIVESSYAAASESSPAAVVGDDVADVAGDAATAATGAAIGNGPIAETGRRAALEEAYKMGYNDGVAGRPYDLDYDKLVSSDDGGAFNEAVGGVQRNAVPAGDGEYADADADIDWQYAPPPAGGRGRGRGGRGGGMGGLGMGLTMTSAMHLLRTVHRLGKVRGGDGRWSRHAFVTNLRRMDVFQMLMLAMSLWRIFSTFKFYW